LGPPPRYPYYATSRMRPGRKWSGVKKKSPRPFERGDFENPGLVDEQHLPVLRQRPELVVDEQLEGVRGLAHLAHRGHNLVAIVLGVLGVVAVGAVGAFAGQGDGDH